MNRHRAAEVLGLLLRCLCLLFALVLADRGLSSALTNSPSWRTSLDPRARLLWDSHYDGSSIVLLGDSSFASYYVDAPEDTLWSRLSAYSGKKVFPAALNGALPGDFVSAARRIAAIWPPGTSVFIGIQPLRRFDPGSRSLPETTRYAHQLGLLVDLEAPAEALATRAERVARLEIARRSFLLRNQQWIQQDIDGHLRSPQYYGAGKNRDRVWDRDGDYALTRLRSYEAAVASGEVERLPFSWVESIHHILAERGIRPVVVLTPLNHRMLARFADQRSGIGSVIEASHNYLVSRLMDSDVEFVDFYRLLDSRSFADLNHANALGDDRVARALSAWLSGIQELPARARRTSFTGRGPQWPR